MLSSLNRYMKAQLVGYLDQQLAVMNQYTPRFRALRHDPSGFAELRSEVSPLMNFWVNVGAKIPDGDQSFSETPQPNELQWLRSLDFGRSKAALAHVRRYIPDFGAPASEAGSFEFFETWFRGLPIGWDDWEDALPNDFEISALESTAIWERIDKLLGGTSGKSAFAYLEDSAVEVIGNLEDVE
jgi:hypothetical protein